VDITLKSDLVLGRNNIEVKIPLIYLVNKKVSDKHYGWLYLLSAGIVLDAATIIFVILLNTDVTDMNI
jgi:hypothetical protein